VLSAAAEAIVFLIIRCIRSGPNCPFTGSLFAPTTYLPNSISQTRPSTHSHLARQVAMCRRSAKYLNTGNFQIIPEVQSAANQREVSTDGRRVQRSTRSTLAARIRIALLIF